MWTSMFHLKCFILWCQSCTRDCRVQKTFTGWGIDSEIKMRGTNKLLPKIHHPFEPLHHLNWLEDSQFQKGRSKKTNSIHNLTVQIFESRVAKTQRTWWRRWALITLLNIVSTRHLSRMALCHKTWMLTSWTRITTSIKLWLVIIDLFQIRIIYNLDNIIN